MDARQSLGETLARMLAGLWRGNTVLPREAESLVGPALKLGLGGLVGRLVPTPAPKSWRAYRDEYRALALQAARNERMLMTAVGILRDAGVEPLLVKGLSVSTHYPDVGCRPSGDIDLCVAPGTLATAIAALHHSGMAAGFIDLHEGVPDLPHRSWADLWSSTTDLNVAGTTVRALGAEDLLALVCLHFVRHLGERPLWLCDVAVLLENMPASFDWGRCLQGPRATAEWVLAVVSLAMTLLGAIPTHAPPKYDPPSWLSPVLLRRWGALSLDQSPRNRLHPMRAAIRLGVGPWRSSLLLQLGSVVLWPTQWCVRVLRHLRRRPNFAFDVHQVRRL